MCGEQRPETYMRILSLTVIASLLALGCGGNSSEYDAYLTIVGSEQVAAAAESTVPLTVRYHDADDQPLAGRVSFRISGTADATLSVGNARADEDGHATVNLIVGRGAAGSFEVIAEASGAAPAVWTIEQRAADLRMVGDYALESRFHVDGLPAGQFRAVTRLIEMTDDLHDPATWVLDRIEGELGSTLKSLFRAARTGFGLDGLLNQKLRQEAPALIDGLVALGQDLDDATRHLGVTTLLDTRGFDDVEGAPAGAIHDLAGAIFWIDGERHAFTRGQMGVDLYSAEGVSLTVESSRRLAIAAHTLRLPYGEMLGFAVERVIVPRHDAAARSLPQLIAGWVGCPSFGQWLADELDFGSASLFRAACQAGVAAALADLDEPFGDAEADLTIRGTARPIDLDGDYDVDELRDGRWEGSLGFDHGTVTLARPAQSFEGKRVR
jgi:hypothetical protein